MDRKSIYIKSNFRLGFEYSYFYKTLGNKVIHKDQVVSWKIQKVSLFTVTMEESAMSQFLGDNYLYFFECELKDKKMFRYPLPGRNSHHYSPSFEKFFGFKANISKEEISNLSWSKKYAPFFCQSVTINYDKGTTTMNQKGFAHPLILLVLLALVAGGVFLYFSKIGALNSPVLQNTKPSQNKEKEITKGRYHSPLGFSFQLTKEVVIDEKTFDFNYDPQQMHYGFVEADSNSDSSKIENPFFELYTIKKKSISLLSNAQLEKMRSLGYYDLSDDGYMLSHGEDDDYATLYYGPFVDDVRKISQGDIEVGKTKFFKESGGNDDYLLVKMINNEEFYGFTVYRIGTDKPLDGDVWKYYYLLDKNNNYFMILRYSLDCPQIKWDAPNPGIDNSKYIKQNTTSLSKCDTIPSEKKRQTGSFLNSFAKSIY